MSVPSSRVPHPALRRVVPVVAGLLALGGLAACAEPTPVVTSGGTVAPSGAASASGTPTTGSGTASASTSTTAAAAWPTAATPVSVTITDSGLGHRITADKVLRGLPWPAGYDATAQAYELVAVEMTWTPSTTYTAPLRKQDFSVRTGAQFPSRPTDLVDAAMAAHGLSVLPAQVESGKSASGWVVFKVDPKGAGNLSLVFTRPKAAVDGSTQVFDTKVFGAVLLGQPVPTS